MTQNLPAYLQQYQVPDLGATLIANLGSAMPPHVTIGNGRFTLIDAANNEIPVPTFDPQLGPYLDACIVDVADVMSRIYFEGAYDSTAEGKRPDCFSDNGIGPSVASSTPQAPTCAACPRAEWTKINANGKKVPWCTQKYKIALLIPGFQTLFLLAVPPASHGALREYTNLCKGNGALVANLVTRMWFVSQGVLGFRPVNYIDEAVAKLRQEAYVAKLTDTIVGRGDIAKPAHQIAAPVQAGQQVQLPGPFAPTPAGPAGSPSWPQTNAAQTAATTSPSEAPAGGRRKRRTAAEIAAANGGAPGGPQQAPFPHPGQQTGPFVHPAGQPASTTTHSASIAGQTGPSSEQQLEFGIGPGQDAAASPEVKGMLDNFFGGQP